MMKHEFDNLVGLETDPECYKRIEEVYNECDFFETKQQIASFYKKYDMNGIERMYTGVVLPMRVLKEQIKGLTTELGSLKTAHKIIVADRDFYKSKVMAMSSILGDI